MMLKEQRKLTDKIMFEDYMVSSQREEQIFSRFPYYLDQQVFEEMVNASMILDKLVGRILDRALKSGALPGFQSGDFPFKNEILGLKAPLLPFFWVRYDAFQREGGGIFFSEFNYDKPCAQREIVVSDGFKPQNNPNSGFAKKFAEKFEALWKEFNPGKTKPIVAILVDPSHYEEVHLAYLYTDLLKPLGYEVMITGGNNLHVAGERVHAFGTAVDILLRQYPTQYLYEVQDFGEILRLFEAGKVLLVNDPRAILGQTKSLFACLWEMADRRDPFLSEEELSAIQSTLPRTKVFEKGKDAEQARDKDRYVIKAAYGRYSEEVYIGTMHTGEEWEEVLQYVSESDKLHILQEFCPIKRENVLRFAGNGYCEEEAFGNFGIYLMNGEFSGICARWSSDYLTSDDIVWSTPVGLRGRSLRTERLVNTRRRDIWTEINDEAAFKWGYTDSYTGREESFLLEGLVLDPALYEELRDASRQAVGIIKKTTGLVQENDQLFCPALGISDKLSGLAAQRLTDCLTFIGRFDWVLDTKGGLKLLEFNSETPGGLLESVVLNPLIREKAGVKMADPNENLGQLIRDVFARIVEDYSKGGEIHTIGIVSSSFHEDWYNTTTLLELLKPLPYHFILGEVSGLEVRDGKLYLYGTKLDAVYRYYPLDWFEEDAHFDGVLEAFAHQAPSINPPATIINQSKAFFALVWELMGTGFYTGEETDFIQKYIPRTALNRNKLGTSDFCAKPFLGREGQGILHNYAVPGFPYGQNEFVFQERVDIQSVTLDIHTPLAVHKENRYPILGSYIVGDEFGGVFTRAGKRITDKRVVFLPTYVGR